MSYFRYINKGNGPTKLFVSGIHGNEGKSTLNFLKLINYNDFSNGKTLIYNFDKTPYISTLKEEYYSSEIGKRIIAIINKYKPDFYTELHCYNINNYKKLISPQRREIQGVPPLIELENRVLISSVSPLIRKKYFKKGTVCKTLEIPCLSKNSFNSYFDDISKNNKCTNNDIYDDYNEGLAIETYFKIIKLIAKSNNRKDFENSMSLLYSKQLKLATKYAKEIFGEEYSPF